MGRKTLIGMFLVGAFTLGLAHLSPVLAVVGQWSASGNNMYYNDGNIGIGTSTPQSLLHLKGNNLFLKMESNETSVLPSTDSNMIFRLDDDNDSSGNYAAFQQSDGAFLMTIQDDGKVGVGTPTPQTLMDLLGNIHGGQLHIQQDATKPAMGVRAWNDGTKNMMMFYTHIGAPADSFPMVITEQGKVGVRTINPTRELSVNGTVLAKEVIVSTAASYWPDYVFGDGYKLMPVQDLERYIQENDHLPGVVAASQIEKEGVPLGEMQRKQMEKIEELMLYIIQQDKRMGELEKRIETLKSQ